MSLNTCVVRNFMKRKRVRINCWRSGYEETVKWDTGFEKKNSVFSKIFQKIFYILKGKYYIYLLNIQIEKC